MTVSLSVNDGTRVYAAAINWCLDRSVMADEIGNKEAGKRKVDYSDWNFVSTKAEMLGILVNSKQHGSAVGIIAPAFGDDICITAVEDIILEDGKTIIILKQYDRSGYMLASSKIALEDVASVCPFSSEFRNPYLDNFEKDRTWFF